MPDLSVVIVNYNTRDKLRDCLESLLSLADNISLEIFVVDNNSSDGSSTMVKQYDTVILLEQGENQWFAGGNNIGIHHATSDIVCFLNPDTLVPDNTLAIMLTYLRNTANVGAVTCKQIHPDGDVLPICSRERQFMDMLLDYTFLGLLFSQWKHRQHNYNFYSDWQRDSVREVEVAPGSCLMAFREDLLSFGVFDERLRLYFNDDDLCHNIRALGKTIYYLPDAWITHYEKSSVQTQSKLARQMYFEGLLIYSQKHFGILKTAILKLLLIPTYIGTFLKEGLKS